MEFVIFTPDKGPKRIMRTVYEACVFQALRERLRCKEIWVTGADNWRNPDDDLPDDFEVRRAEYYEKLNKPREAQVFTAQLKAEMRAELGALDTKLPKLHWVTISGKHRKGAIKFTDPEPQKEPKNLRKLKKAIRKKWGTVALIDILKEAALRTGMLKAMAPVGTREAIDEAKLLERLLLIAYAYGTNSGISSVASGAHGHSEEELRYIARRYLTAVGLKAAGVEIANATFAARSETVWGQGTTTVASDSTHFKAWDRNIFTEWHSRYGGRGVLVYWHIEKGSMAIHSQLLNCTASEVAAAIEGMMRHATTMQAEGNYVDSHGQSEIGFGLTRLLGYDLLSRIKQINKVKLYRPGREDEDSLRRFTRTASHPVYQAMLEVGKAQKTIFVARYLRDRDLQREIQEGVNVVEGWNGANDIIFFGKSGELSSNRRDQQELSVVALHLLQTALVFVNTLMIQEMLADPEWANLLTEEDKRALTPLFWMHIQPFGEVRLNMGSRLQLAQPVPQAPEPTRPQPDARDTTRPLATSRQGAEVYWRVTWHLVRRSLTARPYRRAPRRLACTRSSGSAALTTTAPDHHCPTWAPKDSARVWSPGAYRLRVPRRDYDLRVLQDVQQVDGAFSELPPSWFCGPIRRRQSRGSGDPRSCQRASPHRLRIPMSRRLWSRSADL
ncbi:Tn3 family transposase [Streptomyces sp. NPDC005485]|uniref:Tn3 family transposase n=1 Tax=Streptomyces sp. NPDC005485 TaxID=3155591 RepID=UPI0033BC525F